MTATQSAILLTFLLALSVTAGPHRGERYTRHSGYANDRGGPHFSLSIGHGTHYRGNHSNRFRGCDSSPRYNRSYSYSRSYSNRGCSSRSISRGYWRWRPAVYSWTRDRYGCSVKRTIRAAGWVWVETY